MKAARYTAYGGPTTIAIDEVPIPSPGPGDLLIRVHAAPVTAGDVRMRSGKVPRGMGLVLRLVIGLRRPKVAPGWSFAGTVAGLGDGVTGFRLEDRVFGLKGFKGGAHRDYLTIPATGLVLPLPDSLTKAEGAAFCFGGLTATQALIDEARVGPGHRVLVAGATGAVGSAAVQIARHLGAEVTALASPQNHALAQKLGATCVADYRDPPPEGPYDAIIDMMGTLGWKGARPLLAPSGTLVMITATLGQMIGAALWKRRSGRRIIATSSRESLPDLQRLLSLHQAGGYTPVISQTLPFDQLQMAHEIAESFHKPGNLVVEMVPIQGQPDRPDPALGATRAT